MAAGGKETGAKRPFAESKAIRLAKARYHFGLRYTGLEMDVVALVASKAAVAAQKAGAKSFALGNAVRKAARQIASFQI